MTEKLFETLNRANQNDMADIARKVGLGSVLASQVAISLYRKAPTVGNAFQLSTLDVFILPDAAKAASVLRAKAFAAGTGTLGELAPQAYGATPIAAQIAVAPNGDLVVLATEQFTQVDIVYMPVRYDIVTLTNFPAPAGVLTLPTGMKGCLLLEAEATAGTITGKKIILVPAASAPATTKAALKTDGSAVLFNTATDVVTAATVKLAVVPSIDYQGLLMGDGLI